MAYNQRNKEDAHTSNAEDNSSSKQASFARNYFLSKLKLKFRSIFEGNRRFHLTESMQQHDQIN
ncbi:hypothetical protein KMI_11g17230 [Encephalitozoon hellem]|uniref:Amyloid-like protein n=1 Tax=Encephalitozoon hellem TaxID=27973 RepID=A0A9Q9C4E4_ENCHE|nr:uncharacterized protein EHEL_090425 [Encephalitozoon hellem ATCC 50504]AHL28965.1 hypothetical protein EHEL_090425 [Encephalitozoon hellem ATCC 50504]KAG5858767.1 hypothetical protein KMI_11g17230 [Encephalitozoon hellem]UTX43951.1 hypothetical protein GPU96_09g17310 [Encephalitozoon hellem]WEL39435.1 putative amyloid precursor-like protein [Encephalitozoon hellem]